MICFGCGVKLQSYNENLLGFVLEKKLAEKQPLCKRCFSIKHYSKSINIESESFDPVSKIKNMNIKHSVIAVVCDIYSISSIGRIFKQFNDIIKDNKVWIIINKIDLLPKSVNHRKIRDSLVNNLKVKYKFDDIIFLSSYKKINIDLFLKKANNSGRNVYLIGYTNSGKSSIANAILKSSGADDSELIVKSHIPNTTISKIEIPISKSHKLLDLPGLKSTIKIKMDDKNIKIINVLDEQKAVTYQLESGQKVYLDNIACIDFVEGEKTNFTFYVNNDIKLHRAKSSNNSPKINGNIKLITDKKEVSEMNFKDKKYVDIEIPYTGFIRFKSNNQKLKITSIFTPSVRNSIL